MLTEITCNTIRHFNQPLDTRGQTVLSHDDFSHAHDEISQWPGYQPTPLHQLPALATQLDIGTIYYKDEGSRFGLGSFKALGGAYAAARILQRELGKRLGREVTLAEIRNGDLQAQAAQITLVAATDGNHGRSLAWGAQLFGAPCRIYIHREVSAGRAAAISEFSAQVIRIDGDYDDSVRIAREEAEANGWFVVSDTSWPGYTEPPRDVMAGYGVMASEIVAQIDQSPSHVLLQAGVGGLAAAISAVFHQHWGEQAPRVVVVEPDRAACLLASAVAGRETAVTISEETLMAGLSCGEPSNLAWQVLAAQASDFLSIPDALIAPTMRLLANPSGSDPVIAAGESAVAGLAALITCAQHSEWRAALALDGNARVLLIGSEGVTDQTIYQRIMQGATR